MIKWSQRKSTIVEEWSLVWAEPVDLTFLSPLNAKLTLLQLPKIYFHLQVFPKNREYLPMKHSRRKIYQFFSSLLQILLWNSSWYQLGTCFDKTRRSLHKQLKKEQSPTFNLNDPVFFTCSSGMGSLSSMYTVGCIKGTEVRCRLSQEASSLPSGERKKDEGKKKKNSECWMIFLTHSCDMTQVRRNCNQVYQMLSCINSIVIVTIFRQEQYI